MLSPIRPGFGFAIMLFLFALASSSTIKSRAPKCTDFVVPVTISSALSANLPQSLLTSVLSLVGSLISLIFDLPISGTYNIGARYCEPEVVVASRANTIQFLTHGATYNHSAPGVNPATDIYSWQSYASKQGYPTFSYDRLGNGVSDHPDPLLVVQIPAHVEIAHQLSQMLRTNSPNFQGHIPRAFNKVIGVGHSVGSIVLNQHTFKYPTDFDSIVLTGFSKSILLPAAGVLVTVGVEPAFVVNETEFGGLPIGYLAPNSFSGWKFLFYYSANVDPVFQANDYALRGTITVGEGATAPIGVVSAPGYKGSVYVISGNYDVIFCTLTGTMLTGPGNCGGTSSTGLLAQTASLYPNAADYEYYAMPNSGHCWQFHLDAQNGFQKVHDW